jgi:hypothetical protein
MLGSGGEHHIGLTNRYRGLGAAARGWLPRLVDQLEARWRSELRASPSLTTLADR